MDTQTVFLLVGIVTAWFALNRWILPWLGVPTCMSGGCSADSHARQREQGSGDNAA
jgi:hypothetical protein